MVLLDDLLVTASISKDCEIAQQALMSLLIRLGFAVNQAKVVFPRQRVPFLRYVIDSIKENIKLPQERIKKLKELCLLYSKKSKITKQEF